MRNYSLCYLDALGRTQRTEYLPVENDKDAVNFARIGIVANAVVEVWKDNDLVDRLYQKHRPTGVENADVIVQATAALRRADEHQSLQRWDDEGGGMRPSSFLGATGR